MRLKPSSELMHKLHVALGHLAHKGEHGFHIAYLGGVAFGGGYRYAAIGVLVCIALSWLTHVPE